MQNRIDLTFLNHSQPWDRGLKNLTSLRNFSDFKILYNQEFKYCDIGTNAVIANHGTGERDSTEGDKWCLNRVFVSLDRLIYWSRVIVCEKDAILQEICDRDLLDFTVWTLAEETLLFYFATSDRNRNRQSN